MQTIQTIIDRGSIYVGLFLGGYMALALLEAATR